MAGVGLGQTYSYLDAQLNIPPPYFWPQGHGHAVAWKSTDLSVQLGSLGVIVLGQVAAVLVSLLQGLHCTKSLFLQEHAILRSLPLYSSCSCVV